MKLLFVIITEADGQTDRHTHTYGGVRAPRGGRRRRVVIVKIIVIITIMIIIMITVIVIIQIIIVIVIGLLRPARDGQQQRPRLWRIIFRYLTNM